MTPQQQAQHWLNSNCLILDTETTGLGEDAEIVEITIIDVNGNTLLDTLVKPSKAIPAEAAAIHGITDAMVIDAPCWTEVYHKVDELTSGKIVVTYNASYDARVLDQTDFIWGVTPELKNGLSDFQCAMRVYAEFYGQTDEKHGGYKRQKLTNAAKQQGITIKETLHRSLSDCLTTLGIIRVMAAAMPQSTSQPTAQYVVNTLNTLFQADPDAIAALVDHRVECSEYFAAKTLATVGQYEDKYIVGLVGILNALTFPEVIAAIYDGNKLTGFMVFGNPITEGGAA